MIHGIGIDCVEIKRFEDLLHRHGDNFIKRIFHANEISYCSKKINSADSFAARFAAKEALMKAVGTDTLKGYSLKEMEVTHHNKSRRPIFQFHGETQKLMKKLGHLDKIHLSISHDGNIAAAQVIVEK